MSTGKVVRRVGDDVSTDIIYPGRFMATVLPTETPQYAFADDADPIAPSGQLGHQLFDQSGLSAIRFSNNRNNRDHSHSVRVLSSE